MKIHHFIAPALAIAGSAYWLNSQSDTIRELTEKNPLAPLEAFGDPVTSRSSGLFWTQKQILQKVAKTDPAAALAEEHQLQVQ